jgi:BirA family biotin operon repressor/biotin-[acetyl-CoA-carboxylase] ligase
MTPTPERCILRFPTVDSTQRLAAAEPLGTVVVADAQTAGQGRHGHSWHSEPGNGVYLSIVLEPTPLLTLALGVAAVDAIAQSTGITCDLRWPNDLMLDNRKCAGILVQLMDGRAIAGIGININHTSFPPELEATSLHLHSRRAHDREAIFEALLPAIDSVTREAPNTILRLFAHASSYVSGRRVTVDQPGGTILGTTAGLTPEGHLIVRKDDGTDTLVLAGGVRAVSA